MRRANRIAPRLAFGLLLAIAAHARPALAGPLPRAAVPEPLRPWVDWVLRGHEEAGCPIVAGPLAKDDADGGRRCSWPARLVLDLGQRGGAFEQDWRAFRETWVPLPGDERIWPQDVRIDGRAAVVVPRDARPGLRLTAGAHRVAGQFAWSAPPPVLQVPPETGLLALSVRGVAVPFPARDEAGRVWLQQEAGAGETESRLTLTAQRHVDDDVPLVLTTRVELRVSGRSREVSLGRVLPEGFVPMALDSPIAARLDPAGTLLAQVRPGAWTLTLRARHDGPVAELRRPAPQEPWPTDEVWVFQARPALRQVTVSGAPALDPQQTTLPDEWKALPAYLMRAGDALVLEQKQRGDADPAPDRLTLARTWWLDFDGGGYTVRDHIEGAFVRSWRLELPPPAELGRVTIGGTDQLITARTAGAAPGFEVRQGRAAIEAESRLPRAGAMSAVGWEADFQQVGGDLRLPPGWRLWHASGVDEVRGSWIASWSLLDLFLVFVTSLAAARLWGPRSGVLALAALALSWIEIGAPRWCWVAAVATAGLVRVLPEGRLRWTARLAHGVAIVALVLVLVPFLVGQARIALHPALERPLAGPWHGGFFGGVAGAEEAIRTTMYSKAAPESLEPSARRPSSNLAFDPSAAAQTGPGLPGWSWRSAALAWRGPVERHQPLRLLLVPPWLNALLGWCRIALLAALSSVVLRRGAAALESGPASPPPAIAALAVLACLAHASGPAHADLPSPAMLEELRRQLLAPPDCLPECLSSPRLALEATPSWLRLRVELHAAAAVAAPLPGGAESWLPERVILDGTGAPALARSRDGRLWIALEAGTHQVVVEGPLPDRAAVALPLPLRPWRVEAQVAGWTVEGLRDDGSTEETLQLVRLGAGGAVEMSLAPQALPPFVRVEREIEIGLRWEVRTRIVRLTPPGAAVLIDVPLLPGESVTSAEVRVSGGRATVGLGPDASEAGWTSVLEPTPALVLAAPNAVPWVEVWRATVGPVWHVETAGIPTVHAGEPAELRAREWRPWPGETVTLHVTRPEAVPGATVTVDATTLTLVPGLRASEAALSLTARASRGAENPITLPEGATLQEVSIDGATAPIRQEGRRVVVPLVPGRQELKLAWREPRGIAGVFRASEVQLGVPTVNATTILELPRNRWTLWVRGPRLGPAVLFWTVLAVALLASIGLGAIRLTPLRWHHWFVLSLGLTQVSLAEALAVAAWPLALGWRRRNPSKGAVAFDAAQLALGVWTVLALVLLFHAIERGLLGLPEMQITGNGSVAERLVWDLDRTAGSLPRPVAVSVPLFVYRLAMLAWSLWLARAALTWLRWGWECLGEGGLWRPLQRRRA
jgi:hypothetical protein